MCFVVLRSFLTSQRASIMRGTPCETCKRKKKKKKKKRDKMKPDCECRESDSTEELRTSYFQLSVNMWNLVGVIVHLLKSVKRRAVLFMYMYMSGECLKYSFAPHSPSVTCPTCSLQLHRLNMRDCGQIRGTNDRAARER